MRSPASKYTPYDLIIVGAGPAGSAAALYAARSDIKTLLLEKDQFPRDKICMEGLFSAPTVINPSWPRNSGCTDFC